MTDAELQTILRRGQVRVVSSHGGGKEPVPGCALTLPWPPSTNHYWRHVQGKTLLSAEGRQYRSTIQQICQVMRREHPEWPFLGRLQVWVYASPPDKVRRDLDNLCKSLLDALERGGVYANDGQIDDLRLQRLGPMPGGQVHVVIVPLGQQQKEHA